MESLLARYRAYLPVGPSTPSLTLGEGNTPLLPAPRLGKAIGCPNLYLKFEGMNPTGSFKDRGMVLAVSKAVESGSTTLLCASTGNTAASAAAYAASAGLSCGVILPAGHVAPGKLAQALTYGAIVIAIDGGFDRALALVKQAVAETGAALVNSLNPYRIEGQKTAAFEICDELGGPPGIVALPVGNAGNITAYWKGFCEYRNAGRISSRPQMWGFQASGAAPLVRGEAVENPETVATAIRIGNPARGPEALQAVEESSGMIASVCDEEIMRAYRLVASLEGVMCEPASAAPIAGLAKMGPVDDPVVAVLTGHGLKDPAVALSMAQAPQPVPAALDAVLAKLRSA
ncbi:MAG: threonine synthase [Chloroflexota bacterium]